MSFSRRRIHLRPSKSLDNHQQGDHLLTLRPEAISDHFCKVPQSPISFDYAQKHLQSRQSGSILCWTLDFKAHVVNVSNPVAQMSRAYRPLPLMMVNGWHDDERGRTQDKIGWLQRRLERTRRRCPPRVAGTLFVGFVPLVVL